MKKNAIIYIDDTHAQVTKAFEKQARIFGTPEYREWRAYDIILRSNKTMYYVLFIRNDFQPDEKYFYFRECDAAYHFSLFANDDSNLYQEIELHHIDNETNYDFCISKKYFITQK